ncbi:MAG: hypothetical protein WBG46_07210 [Nonlabens sp.]
MRNRIFIFVFMSLASLRLGSAQVAKAYNNVAVAFLPVAIVLIMSCSEKKLAPPVYYLENELSEIRMKGPIRHLDGIILLASNNKVLKRPYPFEVPVQGEAILGGGGGVHQIFDKYGEAIEMMFCFDSIHFYNPHIFPKSIYRDHHVTPQNFPQCVIEYDGLIHYPGKMRRSEATYSDSSHLGFPLRTESLPDGSENWWQHYSYELDSIDRVKYRRLRKEKFKKIDPFYSEVVRYRYDSLNRIHREDYKFFEMVEGEKFTGYSSASSYFYRDYNAATTLRIEYNYDDNNRLQSTIAYRSDVLEKSFEYTYRDDGSLLSRLEVNHLFVGMSDRGYSTYLELDKNADIIYSRTINKDGSLKDEAWVEYYDHDEYGNWTRSGQFLNGAYEGEPDVISLRNIEYRKRNGNIEAKD